MRESFGGLPKKTGAAERNEVRNKIDRLETEVFKYESLAKDGDAKAIDFINETKREIAALKIKLKRSLGGKTGSRRRAYGTRGL